MKVIGLKAEHLLSLEIQPAQAEVGPWLTPEVAAALAASSSWTWLEEGKVLGCAGIMPDWIGRAQLWSFLSIHAAGHMLPISRSVKALLNEQPFRRLESTTRCDFEAGHRWLKMLGFELETPRMKLFDINGNDHAQYVLLDKNK